jgi:hypothetical protein
MCNSDLKQIADELSLDHGTAALSFAQHMADEARRAGNPYVANFWRGVSAQVLDRQWRGNGASSMSL